MPLNASSPRVPPSLRWTVGVDALPSGSASPSTRPALTGVVGRQPL